MRANLEAAAGAGFDSGDVDATPGASWWQGAEEMTMTIVVDADANRVAAALGLDLPAMDQVLLREAPHHDDASPLALVAVPGAVAIAEPNGRATVQTDTVVALSRIDDERALAARLRFRRDGESSTRASVSDLCGYGHAGCLCGYRRAM